MKTKLFKVAALIGASLLSLSAVAQVTVKDPWVRGTVAEQKATGAFMALTAAADSKLVGAASPLAGTVEIHEMAMDQNVMKMRPVAALALPAGRTVELKPGGYHVMLMDLKQPLKKGDTVPITLKLQGKDGKPQEVEVKAEVRDLAATGGHPKH